MSNLSRIPFTEMFERVKLEFVRDDATGTTVENQYKGRVNDLYLFEIPTKIDWRHVRKTAGITTTDDYSTGTITSISGTTVTGSSTSWTSANSNNLLFKHDSFDEVYRATYVSSTSLTLDRSWSEGSVTAGGTYKLAQDRYALASDFDQIAEDVEKSVYYWSGGTKQYLTFLTQDQWDAKFTFVTSSTPGYFTTRWLDGSPYIHILQLPDSTINLYYDYIPRLVAMTEYTTGTASCTNGATAVTGQSTDFDGYISSTDLEYFSFDGDGTASSRVWYEVSSAASDTSLTLASAYNGATKTAQAYTISKVSLFPPTIDLAIMNKVAVYSATSQNNATQISAWNTLYDQIINPYMARESKSPGNQRMRTVYQAPGVRR